MFGVGTIIKAVIALVILIIVLGGLYYISGLRKDIAISEENVKKMTQVVEQQEEALDEIKKEQQKIKELNYELNATIKLQNKDMQNLKDRFTTSSSGEKRDFGKAAANKPTSLEKAVNRGTVNALRCLELASGAQLTEAEKNATNPNEINKECPTLAHPNYKSSVGQ